MPDDLRAALALLDSPAPDQRRAAAATLFAVCGASSAPPIASRVAAILPDRCALAEAIAALIAAVPGGRDRLLPVARAVLATLASDRLTSTLQVQLAIAALPWDEVGDLLERLAGEGGLHSDALAAATLAFGATVRTDVEGLARLEARLGASPDRYLRRLGLAALVGLSAPPHGWSAERLDRLGAYRADTAAIVAAAAHFTFP